MVYKFVARFGERASSSFRRFGGSEFESQRSPFFKLCTCFFLFRFFIISSLWLVSLYSHGWSLKASRGFCDNVFLVYQLLPGHDRTWKVVRITDHFCKLALKFCTSVSSRSLAQITLVFHAKFSFQNELKLLCPFRSTLYCPLDDQRPLKKQDLSLLQITKKFIRNYVSFAFITNCDSFFITKYDKVLTNCDRYYRLRQNYYELRQNRRA